MVDGLGRLRSIASTALLAEFGVGRGLTMSSILHGSGIAEADLSDPASEIMLDQELVVMRNVVEGIGDEPGLGFLAGFQCHPTSFGVLGFAMISSPTLRCALEVALKYTDLSVAIASHHLETNGSEVAMLRDDRVVPSDLRRFAQERDIAMISTIQQDLLPMQFPVQRVELEWEAHPVYETLGVVLNVDELVFKAPEFKIVLQSAMLEMRPSQANAALARAYEQQCVSIMQRRKRRAGISGRVREMLVQQSGVVDQTSIAADLDVSVRTLRRRLAEEGTTFRELSCETVGLLAEELLLAGLTVESVADRLGYASVSAFASTFRAWKGQTPGTFARTHRGQLASEG
ncbi:AraC family transcriptional regulator ligand-binding domain-containing protein [Nocardia jejuensis]|uniref:AraC family transcriptional regulator ligand-binding domain-containing protein n=1 Tax=Nocardia jejuensis TaxID=328049 RepID=UPI0008328AFC|nr:AraC family transcriptional regulator ligand-binding domain-containing protein [Nocardia jejuensis]